MKKEISEQIIKRVIDDELGTARRNKRIEDEEFIDYINLLDSVRESKQYEWMSDIRIPEFISHVLTQASIDANQYFQTKDFVEVYLQDSSDEALANAEACKELINRTLNQKHLFHYSKYMRAKTLNNVSGKVYARCWWEQTWRKIKTGTEVRQELSDSVDVDDNPLVDLENQTPKVIEIEEPIYEEVPIIDRFNYDIIDPRNVYTDNKYVYSLQQKDWIFIRSEKAYEELRADAESMNYDLKALKEIIRKDESETETSQETYNAGIHAQKQEKVQNSISCYYDVYERFGKYWCIVKERDDFGNPAEVEPGIDEFGVPKDEAEFIETIMTFVMVKGNAILIRFQATPYIDSEGIAYRPIIRGLCYIHPTNDGGIGDGKHTRELQLALDDTINISNDRVMLATLPTFITRKFSADDTSDIYIEPGHNIPLESPNEDLKVLEISDNVQGAMSQAIFLQKMMQQVDAIYPTTMGDMPGLASTTATAVAGSEQRSNMRAGYKSLTFENTFLTDLYWMIMQMTWTFARPETGKKLMGEKIYNYDPSKDYFFKPLSSSIEPEYSKANKIRNYNTILGYVINMPRPDTVKIINYLLSKMLELLGDEYVNFSDKLLNPAQPMLPEGAQAGQMQAPEELVPASNQNGVPMSETETAMRGGMAE